MTIVKQLIVLTGAAGTGKTTVQDYLTETYGIPAIVTHTTRLPRRGEQAGRDYYFETPASFAKLHLLEQVHYAGHQYGSSYEGLQRAWQKGSICSIVLDTAGAQTYVKALGRQVIVLVLQLPSRTVQQHRMQVRGDQLVAIQNRLDSPENQRDWTFSLPPSGNFYQITNQDWKTTVKRLDEIMEKLS
ncbi:hypothetical protein [Fructilactobacillus florum]|nr:hypothetical protein [Fructilactobacillus florum]